MRKSSARMMCVKHEGSVPVRALCWVSLTCLSCTLHGILQIQILKIRIRSIFSYTHVERPIVNDLHAGYRFVVGKVGNMKYVIKIQRAISGTNASLPGLFVLIVMHSSC